MTAQKVLGRSNAKLQEALTRLSTGLRINVGKDDPAGLIASEALRSDITATNRAITNSERANQMIGTADSALGQVSSLLNDIRGLVTEAANKGALSDDQIAANQLQVDSALEAINRIAQTTSFQGRKLLDGTLDFITTAGQVSTIEDLQIDQASLGSTGQIDVNVEIDAAATQASVMSASGDGTATAQLKFAARLVSAITLGTGNGNIAVVAKATGDIYDNVSVVFDGSGSGAADANSTAVFDADTNTLTVTFNNATTTLENLANGISSSGVFEGFVVDGNAVQTVTSGTNGATDTKSLTITAAEKGSAYNGVKVLLQTQSGLGNASPTATYYSDTKRLVITIDGGAANATTIDSIVTAVNGLTDFNASNASNGAITVYGGGTADKRSMANTGISGYLTSGFSAATTASATLNLAAGVTKAFATNAGATAANINIKATALGAAGVGVQVNFEADGTVGEESAVYSATNKTLTIHYSATNSNVSNIVDAINDLDEFVAVAVNGGTGTVNASQTAVTTAGDSITIQSLIKGADYNNMQIKFARQDSLGSTPLAAYDAASNTMTITVDGGASNTTTMAAIASAINGISGFSASYDSDGVGYLYGGTGTDTTATANTGTTGGNTLLADTVMEVVGKTGMEVFTFQAGTSVNQVAAAVNLVSDATGVAATQSHGLLTLKSTEYGSKAISSVLVTSEGSGGTFKTALSAERATGTDVVARINGVKADADGNKMSINTATLDMSLTVTAGSDTDFKFSITGGGALFQLGADVVGNQQARMGIQSVNAGRLGGSSGKLYQLASGGSAALATNANLAATITEEAITKVSSLRGRLGAFQKTTLESNITSLSDTVENLTAAESSIRDADFAAESANLTRAQILVQSGTSVLSIANQNPQNVLALLR